MTAERKPDDLPQDEREKLTVSPEKEIFTEDGYRWLRFSQKETTLPLVALENIENGTVVSTTLPSEFLTEEDLENLAKEAVEEVGEERTQAIDRLVEKIKERTEAKRVASLRAWSGARHSRAPGYSWEIMNEMAEREVDADSKLEQTFVNYGHASVADMAQLYAHIERVPMHLCMATFNALSLNSGQEKSTRYQVEFQDKPLHSIKNYVSELPQEEMESLEKTYQALGKLSRQLFLKSKERVEEEFAKYYKPENARETGSLISRGLDTSRAFLLLGQHTGQVIGESARNWARLIGDLKASPMSYYRNVGEDLERLFVPTPDEEDLLNYKSEAPGLVRHAEKNEVTNNNLRKIKAWFEEMDIPGNGFSINREFRGEVEDKVFLVDKKYASADRAVAQYIISIWPGADNLEVLEWVSSQPEEFKKELSLKLFVGHTHHDELSNLMETTDTSLIMRGSVAEQRDFNRHRAWGRFVELPLIHGLPMNIDTAKQILANGYVLPSYIKEVDEFEGLRKEFKLNLELYYETLYALLDDIHFRFEESIDYNFVLNLLPLSHQVDLWMHGDVKQSSYMTKLRARPGGQINYRIMAWEASKLIAESNPYLSALQIPLRPDPSSREEFFDRS